MKKTIGQLFDELSVTNCKIFYLIDKINNDNYTKEDAKKVQELNAYRSQLTNAINKFFEQQEQVKV